MTICSVIIRLMIDILKFIEDRNLINDRSLSLAQKTALSAFYGLPLTDEMLKIYKQCTQHDEYLGFPHSEGDFIVGRRGGKSDKLASNIAIFEAVRGGHEKQLSLGERGFITIISPTKRQAGLILGYLKAKFQASPLLRTMVKDDYADELHLKNGLVLGCYPCSFRTLRGFAVPLVIVDEAAFLRIEGVNVDKEILEALRPSMAQFTNPKLIMISTPYSKQGVLWDDYRKYFGKKDAPKLIWKAPTEFMNPSVTKSFLNKEKKTFIK